MLCVATFYSHFGATRFAKDMKKKGIDCVLKPVPRTVSSSCGTCAQFESDDVIRYITNDVDGLYTADNDGYKTVWLREED